MKCRTYRLGCRRALWTASLLGVSIAAAVSANAQETDGQDDATEDEVLELEEVVVVGQHLRNYLDNSASTGVGLDLPLIDTPASISVITQDILQDQQVNNVDDALRNVAGVTKFKTGNGGEEKFSIRGFDASQSIYKDGARINNALNASNIPSTETANIERIDVLKGPSALLYGQGEPGGIINYITKRPEFERYTLLEAIGGSFDFYKFEADTTGAFGNSENWAYRAVLAYEDSGSNRFDVDRERLLFNPSITYQFQPGSRIVLSYEYIDDQYTQDRGQVLDGDAINGYFYSSRQNVDQFYGIPNWNRNTEAESDRWNLFIEHSFTDNWRVEATYAHTSNDKINVDSSPLILGPAGEIIGPVGSPLEDLVGIQVRQTDGGGETDQFTLRNFVFLDGPGDVTHQILASFDFEDFSTESTSFRGDRPVFFDVGTNEYFSIFSADELNDPNVITPTEDIAFFLNNRGSSLNQEFEQWGINLVDNITLNERWSVLLGLRYTDFEDTRSGFDEDDLSGRGGIVFKPAPNLSFFLSYSQGFTSSGGLLGIDDQQIDSETSEAFELGAKWALFDDALLVTGTLYRVDQQDLPIVANPFDEDGNPTLPADIRYGNIGEIRSDGLELEVVGQLTDAWRIQAGYSYIDNEITVGGQGQFGVFFPEGNRLPGIAEHSFNLFTFYEIELGGGALGLGGGIFYQDDVFVSTENRAVYDSWTQGDLAAYFRLDNWKFQLNVRNVTDEDFRLAQALTTSDAFGAIRVGTGLPRTVLGSIAYEF
ncbi:MAG: TonB-dependent receptor [Pseudomonadota bacterium]